jgi:hypothetical protein
MNAPTPLSSAPTAIATFSAVVNLVVWFLVILLALGAVLPDDAHALQ